MTKKPALAVYLIDSGLLIVSEGAVHPATLQVWIQSLEPRTVTRYAAALAVEPEVNGSGTLVVAADYEVDQNGLTWPGPDTGRLQEVYRYQGPYLVLESSEFTKD